MKRNLFLFALLAALALSGAPDARAQQWVRTNGPNNGGAASLLASGTNLFAGTESGASRTTDDGATWTNINSGLGIAAISLAQIGTHLFAGHKGMYRSTDNGANWSPAQSDLDLSGEALIAMGQNLFYSTGNHNIWLSTDEGTSWGMVAHNLDVLAFAVSGTNLFAGTPTAGVNLSTNNGTNWSMVFPSPSPVLSFAANGNVIFAGTYYDGAFRSLDNGANWSAANNGLTSKRIYCLAWSGSVVFAGTPDGVFRSLDSGVNWTSFSSGLPVGHDSIGALAANGTNLFASLGDTVWRIGLAPAPPTPPTVAYITPDAGAPGMCVAVEILAPTSATTNYFGFDGTIYPDSLVRFANPGDSVYMKLGPAIVSWDGKVIQVMLFIEPNATPKTIQLQVSAYADPQRMSAPFNFHIVAPSHVGTVTGGGDFGGTIPVPYRSPRNTLVVDSMILQNGKYTISSSDPDLSTQGNQALLPIRILSVGSIRLQNSTLDVSGSGGATGGGGGAGGPGGGGGGGGFSGTGGQGYTGGGGNNDASVSGGTGSGSFSTSTFGGAGLTGVPGGAGEQHSGLGYDDGGGGGTGYPFGTSGVTGRKGSSDPGAFGAGSGGGSSNDYSSNYGGGGGGFATDGQPGQGSGDNHGMAHGNRMQVPFAGGSAGGAGNSTTTAAGGSGGGGAGAMDLTSFTSIEINNGNHGLDANGGSGSNGVGSLFAMGAGGGGGSGGSIMISARDSIVTTSPASTINVTGGGGGSGSSSGGNGGSGGQGRIRMNGAVSTVSGPIQYFLNNRDYAGPSIQRVTFTADSFTVTGYASQFDGVPASPRPVTVYYAWASSTTWATVPAVFALDPKSHTMKWMTSPKPLSNALGDTELYAVAVQLEPSFGGTYTNQPPGVMSHTSGIIAKPPPKVGILSVPPLVDFDTVRKGKCKDTSFMARNTGNGDLTVKSETFGDMHFSVVAPVLPVVIHAGESALLTIRYCATDSGKMLSADTVHSNVSNGVVFLKAFTGLGYLQIPNLIDFGKVLVGACRDTPVVVQNIGTDTLVLTGKTNFVVPFSYVGPEPLRLAPNQIDTITLRFCPMDTGVITQADYLDTVGPGNRANFVLTGKGIQGNLFVDATPIDFGCVEYDSLVQRRVNLNNHGTATVTGITATVNPPGPLTVTVPDTVGPQGIGTMWISLTPTPGSPSSGTITISTSQGLAATIRFTARFSTPPVLVALDSVLDFGSVNIGDSAEMCVRVTNFSCLAIDSVDAALASHNEFSLTNGAVSGLSTLRGRRVVADSTVDTFCVMFKPLAAGLVVDTLSVTSYPRPSTPVPIIIKGVGRATFVAVQLAIDTIFGRPGQIVNVPVRTLNDVTTAAITSLTFRVTFDPMQLDLKPNVIPFTSGIARGDGGTRTTSATTYTNKQYSIGDHEITATFATPLTGKAVIAELPFEILVPTANVAPVRLQSATFGSAFATLAAKQNGAIVIEQCDTTERIGIGTVPLTVIQNSPNPFNPRTSIRIAVGQPGHLTLRIYNSIGSQVMTPFDADVSTGDQTVELDASALPSGAYRYITMWSDGTRTMRDEKTMIVVK